MADFTILFAFFANYAYSLQHVAAPICWEQGQSSAEDCKRKTEASFIFVK